MTLLTSMINQLKGLMQSETAPSSPKRKQGAAPSSERIARKAKSIYYHQMRKENDAAMRAYIKQHLVQANIQMQDANGKDVVPWQFIRKLTDTMYHERLTQAERDVLLGQAEAALLQSPEGSEHMKKPARVAKSVALK